MKLTAEDVAKATKLSLSTVRVYALQKKLGSKEGNRRFFTKADLKRFTAPVKLGKSVAKPKAGKRKAATRAKLRTKRIVRQSPVLKATPKKPEPKPVRHSFWDFFMNRKPRRKIGHMEVGKK